MYRGGGEGCPFGGGFNVRDLPKDDRTPVLFHGSLQGASYVKSCKPWIPGIWANRRQLDCSFYYPRFKEWILNRDHLFLPFGLLTECRGNLLKWLGEDGCVFIRPNSNWKEFTGSIVTQETWERDIELLGWYGIDPEFMCIVARPQRVVAEWRFFVSGKQVLTGSQYKPTHVCVPAGDPIMAFAERILSNVTFSPDPLWVLDLCQTADGDIRVLEVGSFSCAGLYAADTDILAKAASGAALKEWNECQP